MNKIEKEEHSLIIKLLEIFDDSVVRVLKENLDEDVCKDIAFESKSIETPEDTESLKENNIIFKTEYATGQNQGALALLIPEEAISNIADIIMGGKGDKKFKGTVTELEINSVTDLLNKFFKDAENSFKHSYTQDLAFSSKHSFITKEMPDFVINQETMAFDFVVEYELKLDEDKKYKILLLLNTENATKLTIDLGLLKVNSTIKKINISSLDIDRISDVKINITAELGRTRVPIKYALELVRGSLIELDTLNNADIKVFANGVEFAYAQVVAIEDNFGLKITKIISPNERLECI